MAIGPDGGYAGLMWRFPDVDALACRYANAGKADVQACGESSERMEVIAVAAKSGALVRGS